MPVVHYDWDELEDNIVEEYDENGNTIVEYTTKPTLYGDMISQHRNDESHFFKHDGIGNTTEVTDINGNVTDTRQYTAFGEITESTGTTVFPFQFIGQKGYYRDEETGEYLVRRRPYEPVVARWLTIDPIDRIDESSLSPYRYVGGNPVIRLDPSGLSWGGQAACFFCYGPIAYDTDVELGAAGIANEDVGGGNAFLHCVIACRVHEKCSICDNNWDNREDATKIAGMQDLANNAIGRAVVTPCWTGCLSAWIAGMLTCTIRGALALCPGPRKVYVRPTHRPPCNEEDEVLEALYQFYN